MEENAIQIKSGMTIIVGASVKSITYVKKFILETLLHAVMKAANI